MMKKNPPTLKDLLAHREPTDAVNIHVCKHNRKDPTQPETIYAGLIDNVPENVLDLKITAWLRRDGIYLFE